MGKTKPTKKPRLRPGSKTLQETFPHVAAQWDYSANGDLTPNQVSVWSHFVVGWICEKGHRWTAPVMQRSVGNGCPYCSGHYVAPGETDLGTLRPDIAMDWDFERNGDLTPRDVAVCSPKVVAWICSKGHRWEEKIVSRTKWTKGLCPFCSGRRPVLGVTDLATTRPDLAAEWDYDANGALRPEMFKENSSRVVHWVCSPKGHRWVAQICDRTKKGSGCPFCAGKICIPGENDLETKFPSVAATWDHEANGELLPSEVCAHAQKIVFWACENGHKWEESVRQRVHSRYLCPYCSGIRRIPNVNDFAALFPELAAEWCVEKNGEIPPGLAPKSRRLVWWECNEGHRWRAAVDHRQQSGCPFCNRPTRIKKEML